jgi:hypothetical protein
LRRHGFVSSATSKEAVGSGPTAVGSGVAAPAAAMTMPARHPWSGRWPRRAAAVVVAPAAVEGAAGSRSAWCSRRPASPAGPRNGHARPPCASPMPRVSAGATVSVQSRRNRHRADAEMTRPSHPRHTPEQLELFTFAVGQPSSGDSRVGLIKTLQYRVRASSDLPLSVRIELRAILERLKSKADDDDARVIAACRSLRDAAPRIWAESRPVLDALIGQRARLTLEIEGS